MRSAWIPVGLAGVALVAIVTLGLVYGSRMPASAPGATGRPHAEAPVGEAGPARHAARDDATGPEPTSTSLIEEVEPGEGTPAAQAPLCSDALTTRDIEACLEGELGKREASLKASYDSALDRCEEAGTAARAAPKATVAITKAMKAAQDHWALFRGAQCEAERLQYYGGSMSEITYLACMSRIADQRIADLDAMAAEPPEGVVGAN
ncbi:MAG: DUF1311 domain-containing protein [Alphaproteobacteria bacterium]|nr:DUF1311 domain-containing protein [Alphaproteobacteria bacterium]